MARQIDYAGVVLSMDPEQEERKQVRTQLQWDYGQVPALHRRAVEDAAVEILVSGRKMQQSVLVIGQRLSEVKRLLDHGQFGDWCEREFAMNVRTAQRMMSVAANLDGKSDKLSHLGTSVLYLIGADSTPEPVREAVIAQAEASGRSPSVAEVRKSIRLFVENLRGIVRLWAEEHWLRSGREIPPNPSHTNGVFWQELIAWLHGNVTDTWTEADLKAAINQEYRFYRDDDRAAPTERVEQPGATFEDLVAIVRDVADAKRPSVSLLRTAGDLQSPNHYNTFYHAVVRVVRDRYYTRFSVDDLHTAFSAVADAVEAAQVAEETLTGDDLKVMQTAPELAASDLQVMQTAPAAGDLEHLGTEIGAALAMAAFSPDTETAVIRTREYLAEHGINGAFVRTHEAAPGDPRLGKMRRLVILYELVANSFDEFGDLTGRYTETLAAGREMRKLLGWLERAIALLEGREVESLETIAEVAA